MDFQLALRVVEGVEDAPEDVESTHELIPVRWVAGHVCERPVRWIPCEGKIKINASPKDNSFSWSFDEHSMIFDP